MANNDADADADADACTVLLINRNCVGSNRELLSTVGTVFNGAKLMRYSGRMCLIRILSTVILLRTVLVVLVSVLVLVSRSPSVFLPVSVQSFKYGQ